jgi:hypothetical protein
MLSGGRFKEMSLAESLMREDFYCVFPSLDGVDRNALIQGSEFASHVDGQAKQIDVGYLRMRDNRIRLEIASPALHP